VAPAVAITSAPPGSTESTTARFGFTVDQSDGSAVTVTCRLDGAEPTACTDTATYSDLPTGPRRWEVTATDLAGNSTTATHTWVITAPSGGDGGGVDPDPDPEPDPDTDEPGPGTGGGTPGGDGGPTAPPTSAPPSPTPVTAAAPAADVRGASVTTDAAARLALTGVSAVAVAASALTMLSLGAALWLSSRRRHTDGRRAHEVVRSST
jgi:hypothetical protein